MLGDRWSLIVIRDVMFGNRRHYRELLNHSEEGIASNILADRLKRLVDAGLLSRRAQLLEEGREPMWAAFMAELRSLHLGAAAPKRSVVAELQAAFDQRSP